MPALFMLDAKWKADGLPGLEFSPWPLVIAGIAGAILGVVMAILYRNWDRVPLKTYEWEEDDSVPDWFPEPAKPSDDGEDARFPEEQKRDRS